jgi:hypothetical protein
MSTWSEPGTLSCRRDLLLPHMRTHHHLPCIYCVRNACTEAFLDKIRHIYQCKSYRGVLRNAGSRVLDGHPICFGICYTSASASHEEPPIACCIIVNAPHMLQNQINPGRYNSTSVRRAVLGKVHMFDLIAHHRSVSMLAHGAYAGANVHVLQVEIHGVVGVTQLTIVRPREIP